MVFLVSSSDIQMAGRLICLLILFVIILFLAYFAARITGSVQSNAINKQSNIRVIEIFRISPNKTIEIIKIGEHYVAISVCKDNITLLTELDASEVNEQERTLEPIDFKQILDKMRDEKKITPDVSDESENKFIKKNRHNKNES